MASRMLHYVIAVRVANAVLIEDIDRFYIGSLIPDLSSHNDGSYSIAHFLNDNFKDNKISEKRFDWTMFKEKYKDKLLEDFEKDFVIHGKYEKEDLLIYPYDVVMEFLDESIETCIREIQSLRN